MNLMTVARRLRNEIGLKSLKPDRKIHQTSDVKVKRLDFTKKYENLTTEQ